MSDTQQLWNDYAACWSAAPADRLAALAAVAVDGVAYRDPGTEVAGLTGPAGYMAGFAGAFPGHRLRIDDVLEHHGRSLARWTRLDEQGGPASAGISTARHHEDGRLTDITGFFLPTWGRPRKARAPFGAPSCPTLWRAPHRPAVTFRRPGLSPWRPLSRRTPWRP
ncbi:nuclear transport factor 2 family protein [Streptomyces sp. NPDC001436]